ncbi:MAG TPA: flagellar basal-body rod protein FlgF [Sphingomonas sp.]|nr:flagellar basal-body rod protein FlgF [Sphingomonas sp.]
MDKLVYTAATGLRARMAAQAAIANNMANLSTPGFRADLVNFDQLTLVGQGLESRRPTSEEVITADFKPGTVEQTGRPLDVAIAGQAWLAVQSADGTEAYTRRGDLHITATGVLETGDGFPVMGSGGPITVPPADKVQIGADGTISIKPLGSDPEAPMQQIDQLKLVSPVGSKTVKGLDNLLYVEGGGTLPQDLAAKVQTGALEGSNVDMAKVLVDMIENQRAYEVQANLLKNAKDMDQGGASVMSLPS